MDWVPFMFDLNTASSGRRIVWNPAIFGALAFVATLAVTPLYAASMKSAVAKAINTHPTGLAQRSNQRAIANELEESRSQFLPQVNVFGEIGAENVYNPSSLSASDNGSWKASRQVGISVQFTLFDGYERSNNDYRNAARLDGALYSILATTEALALNAVEAYIDVYRHRKLLAIARLNISRHRKILRQIKVRVDGGKSPQSDVFQIEERVFAARAVEVEIQTASKDAQAKYRKAIGISAKGKMRILRPKRIAGSLASLKSSSVANNYELKALSKSISENEYASVSSRASLAPKLLLEGRATAGADRGGSRGEERDVYLGLKLSWKLYDGGIVESRATSLAERAAQAGYLRDARVREIKETAERSWNAYTGGKKRFLILGSQVRSNVKIVRNYREEYELSKRSLLDVLDAERARFNSEFQQISVEAAYRFSTFRMLAIQSKLAGYFGHSQTSLAPKPDYESKFVNTSGRVFSSSSGQSIFNINIDPLK